jgi:hypothetical protein
MVLLDDETYQDVAACDFLPARFSRVKPKTADSSVAGKYSTLGLAGHNTLLELFSGQVPGPRRYTAGLVFSFEHPDAVVEARSVLAERGVGAHYQLVERADPDGSGSQPWYHLLAPDLGRDSSLLLMFNQVTPTYYARLGATPGPDGGPRRRAYLDAVLGTTDKAQDRLLGELVGVDVRLRPACAAALTTVLAAFGYRPAGDALQGPEFAVTISADDTDPEGVTGVAMSLGQAPAERVEFQFGKGSRLVLDPTGWARWSFTPVG